jgi:hypothetical protein
VTEADATDKAPDPARRADRDRGAALHRPAVPLPLHAAAVAAVPLGRVRDDRPDGRPDPKTGKQKPLLRAYSIASPSWDEELEFYSIKVPDGPLTSKLQHIQPGDQIILRPKPVGTLVHDALLPGKRLWFFATGTGFAPFASLLRDPQTYEDYDEVIITHTCREVGELTYGRDLIESIRRTRCWPR